MIGAFEGGVSGGGGEGLHQPPVRFHPPARGRRRSGGPADLGVHGDDGEVEDEGDEDEGERHGLEPKDGKMKSTDLKTKAQK